MKKLTKKIISVILAITIALTSVLVTVAASNECPIDIEITTNKEEYGTLGKAKFVVEVTNKSNATVENVSAEAVFDELDPFGFGSEISAEDSALEPGETLRFEFKATLDAETMELNFIQRILLKILRFFHGDICGFPDEDFDDGRAMTSKIHKVTFGKYEVEQLVEVWYEGNSNETYTVTFDLNYDGAPTPTTEKVNAGESLSEFENPEREGYSFVAWYEEQACLNQFDLNESINKNIVLYAKWELTDKTADKDNDNVSDFFEEFFGSDSSLNDSDNDGLTDYDEIYLTATEPALYDTDNDGGSDADEDTDNDGLTNLEEVKLGSDPMAMDTDGDDISDLEEVSVYGTNPLLLDTDGDAVSDGKEIELGTDPLTVQDSFNVIAEAEDNIDSVNPSVKIELDGSQVETLHVEAFENESFFPETMPGYMGKAYDFSVEGEFDEATISFEFDSSSLPEGAEPTIYYFNEETQELEEMPTTINGNVASTDVTHFSKYILVNRMVYQESFTWTDVWADDVNYTNIEIVFVIDDSGSMDWNDPNYERLTVARNLIDKLPANSKIGLVRFDGNYPKTEALTPTLTTDREAVKNFLTRTYFYSPGGTDMYNGIQKAFPLYESSEETTLKMMIVLSDGATDDTHLHSSVISTANASNIRIYTVGLGSSTSYFNNYLKPLANNTGAEFYLASDATQLADIYEDISDKIDLEADSDHDDVPDYYEDNMVLFNGVKIQLDKNKADTDGDGLLDGQEVIITKTPNEDGTKVMVTGKLVKGDPRLPDSDYDGIKDKDDINPMSGLFIGTMKGYYDVTNASYTMDLRRFFDSNNIYDSKICSTSLVFANTIYGNCDFEYSYGYNKPISSISDLLKLHGFEDVVDYKMSKDYNDDDISEIGIGHQTVTYDGETKVIIAISIRGTNGTIEEWSSNFDMGNPASWKSKNHRGFYVTEERIREYVNTYVRDKKIDNNSDVVYWITGHSRGAAIANLLAAQLIDDNKTVYAYTFATPATTTDVSANNSRYNSIFNFVNTSDVVTYVPLKQWGFKLFGITKEVSVEDSSLEEEWCAATGRTGYNALNKSIITLALERLAKSCASSWSEVFDEAGSQNITDEQYLCISERAKRYCSLPERTSIFGKHKGYKLYPSTAFILQFAVDWAFDDEYKDKDMFSIFKELWNSRYSPVLVLLLGDGVKNWDTLKENAPSELTMTLMGDGHATATYYVLTNS